MQHYGLPTRLLDWTESILIATFFAIRGHLDAPAAVWGLRPGRMNLHTAGKDAIFGSDHSMAMEVIKGVLDGDAAKRTIAIIATQCDVRMLVQLSEFTAHGSASPLETENGSDEFLAKLVIPADAKPRIRDELDALGFKQANLFPDLANLAEDLKTRRYKAYIAPQG